MTVPVNINVLTDDLLPAPVSGAVVTVLDPSTNYSVVGQSSTDAAGQAGLALPGAADLGKEYEVRLFKLGVVFGSPKRILVQEPVQTSNSFDVTGTVLTLPTSVDPRTCRCTGRFVNFANQPIADATLRISSRAESGFETPKVVDGNMVSSEVMELRTNSQGFLSVDLHRGGEYYVMFSGSNDKVWAMKVPDRASANLIELIHPQPVSLTWDPSVAPGAALTMDFGDILEIPFSVLFSNYDIVTEGLSTWVQLASTDTSKLSVGWSRDRAYLTALEAGTAQVVATCQDGLLPARVPGYALTASPLTVTINPAP